VIAHLSGDDGLINAMTSGSDVHRVGGVECLPGARGRGHHTSASSARCLVRSGYGMEAYGLSQRLGVPVDEAAAIIDSYFGAFPA